MNCKKDNPSPPEKCVDLSFQTLNFFVEVHLVSFLYLEAIGDLELLCVGVLHPVVQQHCDHYGDGHTKVSQGSSCLNNPLEHYKYKCNSVQRWKLQRMKIHGLAYIFSMDIFLIHTLAYGFFIGNRKDLAKASRLWVHRFLS